MRGLASAAFLGCALAGCASVDLAPPRSELRHGVSAMPNRVIALPLRCGALGGWYASQDAVGSACSNAAVAAAAQALRSELELRGLSIVDTERLAAETRARTETRELRELEVDIVDESGTTVPLTREVTGEDRIVIRGALFEDATPAEQAALAGAVGAEAILTSRAFVGTVPGIQTARSVAVLVRLDRVSDGKMIRSARCDVEIGIGRSDASGALEALRCAARRIGGGE
jgi:hypothetical protein